MREFKSEFAHSYKTYSFGYCQYGQLEDGDRVSEVYNKGFLPYTGADGIKKTLYMARSARLNLENFSLNSENRRIAKRFDGELESSREEIENFDYKNENFLSFCLRYFKKRHGPGVMPKNRLLTIFEAGFPLEIVTYKKGADTVGYVLEVKDKNMSHYWYSFYDLSYAYQSLGMWMMIDCARTAKSAGKKHYYLGTVYGEKALYKTNFDYLSFWNGNKWIKDKEKLKKLARHDKHHLFDHPDRWKEGHELTFV